MQADDPWSEERNACTWGLLCGRARQGAAVVRQHGQGQGALRGRLTHQSARRRGSASALRSADEPLPVARRCGGVASRARARSRPATVPRTPPPHARADAPSHRRATGPALRHTVAPRERLWCAHHAPGMREPSGGLSPRGVVDVVPGMGGVPCGVAEHSRPAQAPWALAGPCRRLRDDLSLERGRADDGMRRAMSTPQWMCLQALSAQECAPPCVWGRHRSAWRDSSDLPVVPPRPPQNGPRINTESTSQPPSAWHLDAQVARAGL